MKELLNLISESEEFFSLGPIDASLVEDVEQMLGLSFADDYKKYVLMFGTATFQDRELTGICDSERLSVLSTTERARLFYPRFPENMYVVEEMLIDHILVVQDSTGAVYYYGPADEAKLIACSLQEYLFPDSIKIDDG